MSQLCGERAHARRKDATNEVLYIQYLYYVLCCAVLDYSVAQY